MEVYIWGGLELLFFLQSFIIFSPWFHSNGKLIQLVAKDFRLDNDLSSWQQNLVRLNPNF